MNEQNNPSTDSLVLDKELDKYGHSSNDLVAPRELTVTITLTEYKELVSAKAKADFEYIKVRNEKWDVVRERNELKQKLVTLMKLIPGDKSNATQVEEGD